MPAQQLNSGARLAPSKKRYVPLRERTQSNTVPLYDQPEAPPYLTTVEGMLERSTGSLHDSIWAPHNRVRQASDQHTCIPQSRQPLRQPSGPTHFQQLQEATGPMQTASPSVQIGTTESAPWSSSAWGSEPPKPTTAGQGNSSWEAQPSQLPNPYGGGATSNWAVQQPKSVNPEPEGMASTSIMEGQQVSADPSSHLRTVPRQSYVPSHLRGIGVQNEEWSGVQAPIVASVVAKTVTKPVPAQQSLMQATDEKAWLRKLGFEPKVTEQITPLSKGDTEAEEWVPKMGPLSEPAPAKQVTGSLQSPAPKSQMGLQPPTIEYPSTNTQTRASKVRQNSPFNNPQFHLNQNSSENFEQYIQSSSAVSGKKYTFNGLAPGAQNNAAVSNDTNEHSSGAILTPQQQWDNSHQRQSPLSSSVIGPKSVQSMTANRGQFAQNDPNMMFSPHQMAGAALDANNRVATQENVASSTSMKGPWPTLQPADVKSFNQTVTHELNATKQVTGGTPLLTRNALAVKTGFTPRAHSHTFEDQISDDGVVNLSVKEGIRANQEKNGVDQLADWDKKNWAPAPADWENDRPEFDASFVPGYIQEWRPNLPCGPSIQVDTTSEKFKSGKCPINNDVLIDPIEQPESMPDISNGENELKRLHQTALLDASNFRAREEKKQRKAESIKAANEARHRQIAMAVDEPNPFSPKIDMYVRPVQQKDAQDIRNIYNHYVNSSIIPEDQQPISLEDAAELIKTAQNEKLPFVVAVKGRVPPTHDAQGRTRSAKIILPQVEIILGFAFAERFNYAFSGSNKGRSRSTVTIQLYVDHTSTRQGVGRNTLDQLLHCMATAYTFKNACAWINPDNDPIHEPNGCGPIHQMIMMIPVLKKDDLDYPWLSKFLYNKFWFKEEGRLKSVARGSLRQGAGHMLDIAVLQCELLHEGEFDSFS